jgi:hypothetical protein
MAITYRINFENEKDDKLYFYEKKSGAKVIEYAYITPEDPEIHFKTEDGDIKKWPKDEIVSFIVNLYNNISKEIFSERIDLKSKSSKPRFGLKIQGKNINLIHFFIATMGLMSTLKFLGIRYQFGEKKAIGAHLHLRINDDKDKYLSLFASNIIEEYMINGLLDGMKQIFPVNKKELDSKNLWDPFLKLKGEKFTRGIENLKRTFIDQTTAKILEMYNMPSNMLNLLGKFMPKYLMNAKTEDFNNLDTQRIRMAEAISHSAYNAFEQAIGRVRNLKDSGGAFDLKLTLDPLAVIKTLQGSGMLQYTQTTNPLEELNFSAKITKTGVGNMKPEMVTLKKRDLNQSYYGVIAPVSTNEYGNVGSTQTLTNKATLTDRFGSIQQREFTDDINPFDLLSASESLQPFYEYDDTTRRVMGNQQFGQFVQLDHPDEPLVQTSFETIIPHLVSDRFAIKAQKDGRIQKITDEFIIIKNADGTQNKYSIKTTRSRTKRGIYIPMRYYLQVNEGQRVKKGELLATTSSLKTGKLAAGRNLVVAEMSYRGMNYEDGWVVTESVQEKYEQKILEKITVIIPQDAKINNWNISENKETNPGDILISFSGASKVDNFVDEDPDSETSDDVLAGIEFSGKDVNYRSPGGKIEEIIIKLNSKNVDSRIYKEWKQSAKDIEKRQQECQLLKHNHKAYVDCISDITNSEIIKIGGHKVNGADFDGATVEIYIEKPNKISNGSKFTLAATGGKGTVQYIIPKGDEPIAKDTKLKIEFIPTPLSIVSRKNISILLLLYSGKIIYFLNKRLQKLASADKIKEARDLLLEIFTLLDASKDKFLINETMGFFDGKSHPELKKYILNSDPLSRPAFPLLVPPHKNKITMEDIQAAANVLEIPLNEKVYVPEEGITTEMEVPVGIMPVIYLEHFPKAMSGARGSLSVKKQHTTGQGRSGTRVGAGAIKLGLYDLFAMSYKEPGLLIKEVHGLHADNKNAQKKFQKEVLKTGKMPEVLNMKIDADEAKTKKLVEVFFRGAMLDPNL